VFLVSTDAAKCSYERVLFVAVKEFVLELTDIGGASGGQERFTVCIMIEDLQLNSTNDIQFMIRRPRAATTPGAA
jgi:hypothetical protein